MRKRIIKIIIAFIGLTLSPITWWNDSFVNIPISYLSASILAYFIPRLFSVSFILFYWLTNILGIVLLFYGGKELIRNRKINKKRQIITVVVYSIILLILSIYRIIRPITLK